MEKIEFLLHSKHSNRPFMSDASFIMDEQRKPVIIFNHGFKGFKDWGPFNIVARQFANAGFLFIKMNFSHNGVTQEHPNEFVDMEAFARNNFCIELDDTGVLIDALVSGKLPLPASEINTDRIYLLGHSRGGASVLLKSYEDKRIKSVVTWAAVNNLETWHSKSEIDYWKNVGRIYIHNARTNQKMPMDFQLVENFIENQERLQVPDAVKNSKIPMLVIHGSADPTIPVQSAMEIASWNKSAELKIIEGADHTFGGGHPFYASTLPADLQKVIGYTVDFLRRIH